MVNMHNVGCSAIIFSSLVRLVQMSLALVMKQFFKKLCCNGGTKILSGHNTNGHFVEPLE